VPITITPHQLTYSVGDTLIISTTFPDSIYDLGTQHTFKIQGFPFKPISLLYRIMENSHDSGYRVNELRVDSTFSPVYTSSNIYSDGFKAITTYENASYHFEFTLILKELGRYILVVSDLYQEHLGTGNADLNAEANAVTFEGKCPTLGYCICSMIEGDDYLELFEDELVYLDNEV
jgi:hypothetical protein